MLVITRGMAPSQATGAYAMCPDELLLGICSRVTDTADLQSLSCTCKLLRSIVMSYVHDHVIRTAVPFCGDLHVQRAVTDYYQGRKKEKPAQTLTLTDMVPGMKKFAQLWTVRSLRVPLKTFSRFSRRASIIQQQLAARNIKAEILDIPSCMVVEPALDMRQFVHFSGIKLSYTQLCGHTHAHWYWNDLFNQLCEVNAIPEMFAYYHGDGKHSDKAILFDQQLQVPSHFSELVLSDGVWLDGDTHEHVPQEFVRMLSSETITCAGDAAEYADWIVYDVHEDALDEFTDSPVTGRGPYIRTVFPYARILHNICWETRCYVRDCASVRAMVLEDVNSPSEPSKLNAYALPDNLDMIAFPWSLIENMSKDPYRNIYTGRNMSVSKVLIVRLLTNGCMTTDTRARVSIVPYLRSLFPNMQSLYFGESSLGVHVNVYVDLGMNQFIRKTAYEYARECYIDPTLTIIQPVFAIVLNSSARTRRIGFNKWSTCGRHNLQHV
jgi:hypothetical protein